MPSREILEKNDRFPTNDELIKSATGPFKAVKRVPRIELGPALAKIKAAAGEVPNFCRYRPQIGKFAKR